MENAKDKHYNLNLRKGVSIKRKSGDLLLERRIIWNPVFYLYCLYA